MYFSERLWRILKSLEPLFEERESSSSMMSLGALTFFPRSISTSSSPWTSLQMAAACIFFSLVVMVENCDMAAPGLKDPSGVLSGGSGRPEEELKPEILSCITECSPGPHAFLIVLRVEKFSEQEQAIITKICQYFSEEALQYATVVFTHGNQLPPGETIEQFISKSRRLTELVKKCGNRCHVVDNKYWNNNQQDQYRNNNFQVEELLKTIDKMVMENNMGFYTNKALKVVEKEIEKEEQIIKESGKDMTPEEIRTEAKSIVSNRFLISLTGIATGTVLGAIFGVEALVRLFIKHITDLKNPKVVKGVQRAAGAAGLTATEVALAAGAVAVGVSAVGGGVVGGVIGAKAADEADSVQDAFERARKAVMETKESLYLNTFK